MPAPGHGGEGGRRLLDALVDGYPPLPQEGQGGGVPGHGVDEEGPARIPCRVDEFTGHGALAVGLCGVGGGVVAEVSGEDDGVGVPAVEERARDAGVTSEVGLTGAREIDGVARDAARRAGGEMPGDRGGGVGGERR